MKKIITVITLALSLTISASDKQSSASIEPKNQQIKSNNAKGLTEVKLIADDSISFDKFGGSKSSSHGHP